MIGGDQYTILLMFIAGDTNTKSRRDLEDRKEKYTIGVGKKQKLTKLEQCRSAPNCMVEVGSVAKLGELTVDRGEAIKAEIDFCAIKYSRQYSRLSHQEKKDLLRKDKVYRLIDELKGRDGITPSDVKYICPLLGEMK